MNNLILFKELYAQELAIRSHALAPESAHYLAIKAVCRRLTIPYTSQAIHNYLVRGTISQSEGVVKS